MKIDEFDRTIDGYIEADPRDYLKVGLKRAEERERSDIPEEIFDTIAGPLRQRLAERAGRPVKRGDYDRIDALLTEYAVELRAAIGWHRREGMLKPMTAESEVKRIANAGLFQKYLWTGFYTRTLMECLRPTDLPIVSIDFDSITTSSRVITRGSDFWDSLRPGGTSKEFFARQGVSASVIEEAKNRARHVAAETSRPQWNNSPGSAAGPNVVAR